MPTPSRNSAYHVFPVQVPFADGYLQVPDRPGLGVEFNEEAAVAGEPRAGKGLWYLREDGSFTNW